MFKKNLTVGINAMSISEISGIPRATVVRKLKKLVKKGYLSIDNKKHYKLTEKGTTELIPLQNIVLDRLADFSTKIFNLAILWSLLSNIKKNFKIKRN